MKYVIEYKNGSFHLYFITTFDKFKQLKILLKNDFFTSDNNEMNTLVKYVYEVDRLHNYFKKQYSPVLLK